MDTLLVNTGMGFNLMDALLIQSLCSYAILLRIFEQAVNHGQVLRRGGNNDLAGVLAVDPMLRRKCLHAACTFRTNLGFQGATVIVDAAMQHATVAAAGVLAQGSLFFQHSNARCRVALAQLARNRQPDNSTAHNEVIPNIG